MSHKFLNNSSLTQITKEDELEYIEKICFQENG